MISKNPILDHSEKPQNSTLPMNTVALVCWLLGFILIGCQTQETKGLETNTEREQETGEIINQQDKSVWQDATIIGSAETPDPILEKVKLLESQELVKDVLVLESYPIKIRLKAPEEIINELNALPRKKL